MEAAVDDQSPFLLQKGLQLMLSGTEPLVLREILNNYISAGNYSGKEFLAAILIKEGLLAIQNGEHPWDIRERLIAFFGVDFAKEIEQHLGNDPQNNAMKIQKFRDGLQGKKVTSEAANLFGKTFEKLDQRSLQRSLRELNPVELAIGMQGAGGKTQLKIIEGLPKSMVLLLIEADELFDIAKINTPRIVDAQKSIIETIKKLKVAGEIR